MREDALAAKLAALRAGLNELGATLLAFSGGVDSSFVLRIAHEVLGGRLTALTSVSPTNPEHDTSHAVALARSLGVRHLLIPSNELEVPGYAANPTNRCYLCKNRLYEICAAEARRLGIASIIDGVNADDLADYRPGLRAADERGVRHPLVDSGIGKEHVRALSRAHGLASWDRPASPCLSSRFPYGTAITPESLRMVATAEDGLRTLGFRTLRVRFHGTLARVEIDAAELPHLADSTLRTALVAVVRAAGFASVEIDPQGFRSGSLNAGLSGRVHP
ncbi:MAG: ATP-dependent sacrificial sulfur transferase LarE [Deltaproteobacteria bacterium]|nr:ATP-dependent sacrificial sulfur transferase LarE [Deltaproteobacteria bacterium]